MSKTPETSEEIRQQMALLIENRDKLRTEVDAAIARRDPDQLIGVLNSAMGLIDGMSGTLVAIVENRLGTEGAL
jgi:hypothetical protein